MSSVGAPIVSVVPGSHAYGTQFTGYSYLTSFQVVNTGTDVLNVSDDAEIADAIIRLAHALNMRVVAEGVETAEQVAFLKARRCDEIQGYVIAKPLPPDKVGELFAQTFRFG